MATEVWRTGAFPAIPADATGPRKVPQAATSLDMFGGQTVEMPQQQHLSYRRRQQAGIDALIAIATPVAQSEEPQGESHGDDEVPVTTNHNVKRS